MDIKDTLIMLNEKYNPQKSEVIKQSNKNFVVVTFNKGNTIESEFLDELSVFGFKEREDNLLNKSYQSDLFDELDMKLLSSLLNKKASLYSSNYYKTKNEGNLRYKDIINKYESTVQVSLYNESEHNEKDNKKINNYYNNVFKYESELMQDSFKDRFCSSLADFINQSFVTSDVMANKGDGDVIKTYITGLFETATKACYQHHIETHSRHYPFLYLLDTAIGYDNEKAVDTLEFIKQGDKESIIKILNNYANENFKHLDTVKPLFSYKEAKNFPKELDFYQNSDEEVGVNYYLCKSYMEETHRSFKTVVNQYLLNTVINQVSIKNAQKLHETFKNDNLTVKEMADYIVTHFNSSFQYEDNKNKSSLKFKT